MIFRIQPPRSLAAATALLCVLATAPTPGAAQASEPMVYTVGLTAQSGSQHWAYVHWRTTAFDLFAPRVWSVWRKDGTANSPGVYQLEAIVQVQTSPFALAALFDRARLHLGEDTTFTRTALVELFDDLIPEGTLTDAEIASAVIQGVAANPEFLDSLQLAMRTFPSMAMALGTAHAVPIPSSGPVTFEIRYRATPTAADEGVVGRVTVDAAHPLVLPAPSVVAIAPSDPDRPATSDLSVPLRWDTPPALRRIALAQHGFNVWRVERGFAEGAGWNTTPPAADDLAAFVNIPGGPVGRVNQTAVLTRRALDAAEVATADYTVVFATDHESRFPGYPHTHTPPQNGDQYYYFVTARDLLGRDGAVSPGVLGTFCSKLPPRVPTVLRVENDYVFEGTPKHHLRVVWAANPSEPDKETTGYAVYRWTSTGQLENLGGDPLANLIAIVPHTPGPTTFSYLDTGPGAPTAPADYTKTFWYTVRAIDDAGAAAACATPPAGGNLSGHSPPVPGVLRDRFGPAGTSGGIRIRCAEPVIALDRIKDTAHTPHQPLSPLAINVDIVVERLDLDPNLQWVELYWGVGTTEVPLGRFEFAPGETRFVHRLTFPAAAQGAALWFRAAASATGDNVQWSNQIDASLPEPGPHVKLVVGATVGIAYTSGIVDDESGRRPCSAHTPPPPTGDDPDTGIEIQFLPVPEMTQYKLYFRVDDGPLTLLREDSGQFDLSQPIVNLWLSTPLYAGESCFFVQLFDRHGNPSPLVPLGCIGLNFKFPPPVPKLAPVLPGGTEAAPKARVQWFSPRWGISYFRVYLRGLPTLQDGTVPGLTFLGPALIGGVAHRAYRTDDLASGFGQGSFFEIEIPLATDVEFEVVVRGHTVTGGFTHLSNRETFSWSPPELYQFPDVPWPARGLPGSRPATEFNPRIVAEPNPVEGSGMVRIGELIGRVAHDLPNQRFLITTSDITDPLAKVYPRTGEGAPRSLFPFLLYRTQVPGSEWSQVPGDVYQVSPLMQAIAWAPEATRYVIYDPYIYVKQPVGASATPTDPAFMYVIDTQPAIGRARYRYFLVLLNPVTGEIDEILVTNDVTL